MCDLSVCFTGFSAGHLNNANKHALFSLAASCAEFMHEIRESQTTFSTAALSSVLNQNQLRIVELRRHVICKSAFHTSVDFHDTALPDRTWLIVLDCGCSLD